MGKQIYKKPVKKRGISICTGCFEEFKNIDLTIVTIHDKLGMIFQSIFCEKCVKEGNYPKHEKIEIVGPAAKPRKKRVTKPKATPKTKATPKPKATKKKVDRTQAPNNKKG